MSRPLRLPKPLGAALLGAMLMPAHALAAEPGTPTTDGESATLIVILLLGSLTAGLFFASPLRRRLDPPLSDAGRDRRSAQRQGVLRPATEVVARGQRAADAVLDAVGEQVAVRGRRLGPPRVSPPLPPMPGGDVFFADDSPPAAKAGKRVDGWSTQPVSEDRYGRRR